MSTVFYDPNEDYPVESPVPEGDEDESEDD